MTLELRLLASSFLLLAAPAYAQAQTGACQELVLYNSAVATMHAHNTMVRSVTIDGDRIADVSTAAELPPHDTGCRPP